MQPDSFPSNSHTTKPKKVAAPSKKPDKLEKIVTGKVVTRKESLRKRFLKTFISEDAGGVGNYLVFEVLIPAFKDVVSDVVEQAVRRTLFGGGRSPSRRSNVANSNPHVSYNRYSGGGLLGGRQKEERPSLSYRARSSHDFDEIILATRAEAEEVIDRLFTLVDQYQQATVSDLYDMLGLESKFTDERWGWRSMAGAGVSRSSGGYLLDLPKPEQLD